jgi:nucleotide-binding universal stress UspA family protein
MKATPSSKKILIPVDGSDRSLNTVRYIARFQPFHNMKLVLLHIFSAVPEGFHDLGTDPKSAGAVSGIKGWEVQQRVYIRQHLQIGHQFFLKAGFDPESVRLKTQQRKEGVARDIIDEARKGYTAVIFRRRGLGALRSIVMGSVATKLIEKLTFIPLILVGRKPPGTKILLAFDGSEGARQAVDFVGSTLGGFNLKVCLIHVIRGKADKSMKYRHMYTPGKFTDSSKKEMILALDEAKAKLVNRGFRPAMVKAEIITGALSRAGAIASYAKQEDYGTIVMGRRGISRVRDFFIGRVTNKVIHLARDRTIWVIK